MVELVGELDHGRLGDAGRLGGRGGLGHGQGLGGHQPRLPALEVDAQVEAPGAQREDPDQDDHGRDAEPHLAAADEVERGLAPVEADEDVRGASRPASSASSSAAAAPAPPRTPPRAPRRPPRSVAPPWRPSGRRLRVAVVGLMAARPPR